MKILKSVLSCLLIVLFASAVSQELPKGSSWTVTEGKGITIHTYMSPGQIFANTSHVLELENELIIIDGQFFAPYANELKEFTSSLNKPISRFYISHDHPDHYMGFGDAFPEVDVYALVETKETIDAYGEAILKQRQSQFGAMIPKSLNPPNHVQEPGKEKIGGVKFIFEKSVENEAAVSLVIKVPSLGVYIAQDIVYNRTHLFISGETISWEAALTKILDEKKVELVLCGHGKEGDKNVIQENLDYLAFANEAIKNSGSKEEYKSSMIAQYPDYAGVGLIDLYLAEYLKPTHWK